MNGVPDYFEYKVKQTAGGIWYSDQVHVFDESHTRAALKLDLAMTEVEQVLYKHNHKEEKPEKKEE